ncbi:endophilin-B1-like [Symsagittifera roscoffensis]|uniref:endophilin-B1-like n=1 Tax=Symsagittifera roscoffensis TaxID=84072 RepID=UPI00307B3A13
MTNTERFGSNLESAAVEIDNAASTYTQGLKQFGSAQKELGKSERRFGREVEKCCIQPMKKFLAEDLEAALNEKSALDTLRLDLDVAKNKVAKAKGIVDREKAEKVLQEAQKDFDRQHDFTKVIIGRTLNNHHTNHANQLKEFSRIQTSLYRECSLVMSELDEELAKIAIK